jgi:hypothetical protein
MTTKIKYTFGFVVRAMFYGTGTYCDPQTLTPAKLVYRAREIPGEFPDGLSLDQAQYMLDHWDEVFPEGWQV